MARFLSAFCFSFVDVRLAVKGAVKGGGGLGVRRPRAAAACRRSAVLCRARAARSCVSGRSRRRRSVVSVHARARRCGGIAAPSTLCTPWLYQTIARSAEKTRRCCCSRCSPASCSLWSLFEFPPLLPKMGPRLLTSASPLMCAMPISVTCVCACACARAHLRSSLRRCGVRRWISAYLENSLVTDLARHAALASLPFPSSPLL